MKLGVEVEVEQLFATLDYSSLDSPPSHSLVWLMVEQC